MKQLAVLFLFCVLNTITYSQTKNLAFLDWKTTEGSQYFFYKNKVKTDGFNNVYIAGATTTSNGTTDILVSKKTPAGVTLWTRQYNGAANFHDFATGIVISSTGDVYITGAVTNNTLTGATDVIVIKYNSVGTQQWVQTYNGVADGIDSGKDLILDANGNLYVIGGSYNANGNTDFLTLKYNGMGSLVWANTYDYTSGLDDLPFKLVLQGLT
jgi:hypothetical protein